MSWEIPNSDKTNDFCIVNVLPGFNSTPFLIKECSPAALEKTVERI